MVSVQTTTVENGMFELYTSGEDYITNEEINFIRIFEDDDNPDTALIDGVDSDDSDRLYTLWTVDPYVAPWDTHGLSLDAAVILAIGQIWDQLGRRIPVIKMGSPISDSVVDNFNKLALTKNQNTGRKYWWER